MKLRDFRNSDEGYSIGLDIGTGSVGWAVTDGYGELCRFKGKHTWGSRLFPSADPASVARFPRSQRRRYIRRRWRLDLLQKFFAEEMEGVDPEFFIRLRQSRLLKGDRAEGHREYRYPLFNDAGFTEVEYYERFPTIYHLRSWLMEADEKADLRLIYLALHNIVKHRGNFLREGESISAKNANMEEAVDELCEALQAWCDADELACDVTAKGKKICAVLEAANMSPSQRRDEIIAILSLGKDGERLVARKLAKAVAGAIVGLKSDMKDIFAVEADGTSFKLSEDEPVEAFLAVIPPEGEQLFEGMRAAYSSFVLSGMLSFAKGETLSRNKMAEYEKYRDDLKILKALVREYALEAYDDFFRGIYYENPDGSKTNIYDKSKAHGYTLYNLGGSANAYDAFKNEVKKLLAGTAAGQDERFMQMMDEFAEGRFLRRLKTSDNGSIPYQLHLEEMSAILQNQGRFYPFLREHACEIESLVTFRIPYYVGPLTLKNAPCAESADLRDVEQGAGRYRFAWATRKLGRESDAIKPWNWDEIIDTHASAEAFIKRMVGMCTYVQGEEVLPKESLLYQEFCVLNELNGAHWSQDGDDEHRFTIHETQGIMEELFRKRRGKVSYKQVQDWLARERNAAHARVSGGQGETAFESKLSSYGFFCEVFGVDTLSAAQADMAENIILWNTLFEDRSILREKIEEAYGAELSAEQVKKICKKRFAGWGKLSHEFLCGIKVPTDDGSKSVMDVMREGHPNNGEKSRVMVLMEVIRDDDLAFQEKIDERNREYARERGFQLEDIPGSPALRRGINQAVRIVEEIVGIAGKPPVNIFIEVTREDDMRKKGRRTARRQEQLKAALEALKSESPELFDKNLLKQLGREKDRLDEEKVMLYFMQGGKSLYSGKPLDINNLEVCEVDHIIPRSYIKDDSLENKALVFREENQRKLDTLLLDESIRRAQKSYWRALHDAKLIGDKKYNNLMRSRISEKAMKGFINRQLVETSQIVKWVRLMLEERYAETKIVPIKAGITHNLREACDFVKCRDINDYHHAHDAYLACQVGRFVQGRYPAMIDNPIKMAHAMRAFVRAQGDAYRTSKRTPGSAGFVVDSFLKPNFDAETGELYSEDFVWDAAREVARIAQSLDYKDCFISRMPEETRGTFWDATIYSPRSGKNLALPLKEGLDPKKYGSYSREQFAYFFIYESFDSKKGRRVLAFEPVPVRIAASIAQRESALEEYARNLAQEAGAEFVRIVRRKIYKYQLVEMEGERFYLTGKKEVRNATSLAFNQAETRIVRDIADGKEVKESAIEVLFGAVVAKCKAHAAMLSAKLSLSGEAVDAFRGIPIEDKRAVLLRVVSIANAATNMVDMTPIGGVRYAGTITPTFSKVLATNGIVFVDQSVTGMFERRSRIGL